MLLLAQGSCMFSLVYELEKHFPHPQPTWLVSFKNSFIFIHAAVQLYDAPPRLTRQANDLQ